MKKTKHDQSKRTRPTKKRSAARLRRFGRLKRLAVRALFRDGFNVKPIGRVLGMTAAEAEHVLRQELTK